MSIFYNADEIFEMAEQIERNGAKFYRRVAEKAATSQSREFLLHLAAMEDEHEGVFAAIRADMLKEGQAATVNPVFDPEGQAAMYLKAMADGHVFDTKMAPSQRLTGKETMAEILQIAIGLEKDSIVFYLGIKEMVGELGKEKVDQVIHAELDHITLLIGMLRQVIT